MLMLIAYYLNFPATDEQVKMLQYIYITEYYSAIQKDESLHFATTQVKWRGFLKEGQILHQFTHIQYIKKQSYEINNILQKYYRF